MVSKLFLLPCSHIDLPVSFLFINEFVAEFSHFLRWKKGISPPEFSHFLIWRKMQRSLLYIKKRENSGDEIGKKAIKIVCLNLYLIKFTRTKTLMFFLGVRGVQTCTLWVFFVMFNPYPRASKTFLRFWCNVLIQITRLCQNHRKKVVLALGKQNYFYDFEWRCLLLGIQQRHSKS